MSHTQTMLGTGEASRPYLEKGAPSAFAAISGAGIGQDGGELIASSKVNVVARNVNVRAAADLDHAIADAFEQVSVTACLAEVETFIRATSASVIRFEFEVSPDLPLVTCDPLALKNAVLNLLFNARDAMPDGGVISIRTAAVAFESRPGIELLVADSGVGMKPDTSSAPSSPFSPPRARDWGALVCQWSSGSRRKPKGAFSSKASTALAQR